MLTYKIPALADTINKPDTTTGHQTEKHQMHRYITVRSNFHAQTVTIREDVRAGDTAEDAYTRLQVRGAEGNPAARRKLARIRREICGGSECQCIHHVRFGG